MSTNPNLTTSYASAQRAAPVDVQRQAHDLADAHLVAAVADAVSEAVLIVNVERQIVYCNKAADAFLPEPRPETIISLRPGEALACIHAAESPGGCGTTAFCQECGALQAILIAQTGRAAMRECRIVRHSQGEEMALDLRVQATPFNHGGERYLIFSMADISHEKRRQFLERVFFHDLNNTAGIISNLVYFLRHTTEMGTDLPVPELLTQAAHRLRDEIQAQRQLMEAETNELQLALEPIETGPYLEALVRLYSQHEVAEGRYLTLSSSSEHVSVVTDPTLLGRILGNLVKNALEASRPGETVTLGCARRDTGIAFWIRNPGCMPPSVQRQLFQRSFSTKGAGRGLGTYSVKLFGERFLGGRVTFTSTEDDGTTFMVILPERAVE